MYYEDPIEDVEEDHEECCVCGVVRDVYKIFYKSFWGVKTENGICHDCLGEVYSLGCVIGRSEYYEGLYREGRKQLDKLIKSNEALNKKLKELIKEENNE